MYCAWISSNVSQRSLFMVFNNLHFNLQQYTFFKAVVYLKDVSICIWEFLCFFVVSKVKKKQTDTIDKFKIIYISNNYNTVILINFYHIDGIFFAYIAC